MPMSTFSLKRLRVADPKSFLTGLFYLAFGLGSVLVSLGYTLGSLARIGPGYFPLLLGILLVALGLLVSLRALGLRDAEDPAAETGHSRWSFLLERDWLTLAWIIASVVLFGLLLKQIGLLLAIFLLVFIASLASHERNYTRILITALVITLLSYLVFIKGLGVLLPIWPVFL